MPYDDKLSLDGIKTSDDLTTKLRILQNALTEVSQNLHEIKTIVDEPETTEKVKKLDDNDNIVTLDGEIVFEDKVTPAVTRVPDNPREYGKEFTDSARMKQQSDALTQLAKIKIEVDKLQTNSVQ